MSKPKVSIIVAVGTVNSVIGKENGDLPWDKISEDMKHFRKTTTGHPIIMGRKTWETFGSRPLPGRTSIVITRKNDYEVPEGVIVVSSLQEAIDKAFEIDHNQIFIIGGGEIYKQAIESEVADSLYITQVQGTFEGDVKFPSGWIGHFPDKIWVKKIPDDKYEVTASLYSR
jgi:dihydrofolate reductase